MTAATLPDRLAEARRVLQHHFGFPDFRPAQRRVIQSVLAGRDALAVLPTGGGKSICFQVPALVNAGLTLVVSPLISLMQDQVEAARGRGIPAACLTSAQDAAERVEVRRAVAGGALRLLYVSPERLAALVPELRDAGVRPSLLAVDEAHCISEWGHDFRPAYRLLGKARYLLGRPRTVALTGSATPAVRDDIVASLGLARCDRHLGSFDRPNLRFTVVRVRSEPGRFPALLRLLARQERLALVYAPTRNLTEGLARALRDHGCRASPYHAGLPREVRDRTLRAFLQDGVDVVVATSAFGMGIDKPDVRLVAHWGMPPTPESYYQEAGRAGRDGRPSDCVLLYGAGDAELQRRQLAVTFPPRRLCERVWGDPAAAMRVPANVRASVERLRVELHGSGTAPAWSAVRRRRRLAEARIGVMRRYAEGKGCRRAALIGYFGETITRCSGCDRCSGPG